MNRIMLALATIVATTSVSGCATVCNPQNPGAAIQSGSMVIGLTQFGACSGYYLANKLSEPKNQTADEKTMSDMAAYRKEREAQNAPAPTP